MEENQGEERGVLGNLVDKIKGAGKGIEESLENAAGALPAASGDLSNAPGVAGLTTSGSIPPGGVGEASEGAISDRVPVGEAEEPREPSD